MNKRISAASPSGRRKGAASPALWVLILFTCMLAGARAQGQDARSKAAQPRFDPLELDEPWRFRPGDDSGWASPAFNDSSWPTLNVEKTWAAQGFRAVDEGWYRFTVSPIPDTLANSRGHLGLWLGEVVSAYRVFAGGIELGGNGSLPPQAKVEHDRARIWSIPSEAIRNGELTLAIHVYRHSAWKGRDGGLRGPAPRLGRLDDLAKEQALKQLPMVILAALAGSLALYWAVIGLWAVDRPSPKTVLPSALFLALFLMLGALAGLLSTQLKFLLSESFIPLKRTELCFYGLWAMAWAQWLGLSLEDPSSRRWGRRLLWAFQALWVLWLVALGFGGTWALGLERSMGLVVASSALWVPYWVWRPSASVGGGLRLGLLAGALVLALHGFFPGQAGAWVVPGLPLLVGLGGFYDRESEARRESLKPSESSDATAALTQALEEARTLSQARIELLASASHEIRTPMMAILGLGDLLLKRGLPEEEHRHVRTIRSSALALLQVLDDLLQYSRIESGNLTVHLDTFEIRSEIESVMDLLEPRAREKDLVLTSHVSSGTPHWVFGDAGRLRQVMINLVANAIKFTRDGRVTLEVLPARQRVNSDEVTLRFNVRDTGVGVPADEIPKIFSPFTQVSQGHEPTVGTGLGLAISRRIIKALNGRIGADSQVGQGSSFWFEVPLRRVDEPDSATTISVPSMKGLGRVLLAEDNPVNQTVILGQLQSLGVAVDPVFNGAEAVAAMAATRYDLVLMDCEMPVLDGFQAVAQIRAQEAARRSSSGDPRLPDPRVPIIAITAHGFQTDRERCRQAGMDDILVKPFDERQLGAMLDRWLAPGDSEMKARTD